MRGPPARRASHRARRRGRKTDCARGKRMGANKVSEGGKGATPPRFARTLCRSRTEERKMGCVAAHGASTSGDEDSKKLLLVDRRSLRSRPASREGDNSSPFALLRSGTIALARDGAPHHATTRRRGRPWPRPHLLFDTKPSGLTGRSASAFLLSFVVRIAVVIAVHGLLPIRHAPCDRRCHILPSRLDEIGVAFV